MFMVILWKKKKILLKNISGYDCSHGFLKRQMKLNVWIKAMGNSISVTGVRSTSANTTIFLVDDSLWHLYRSAREYKRAPAMYVIHFFVWRRHAGKPEAWQQNSLSHSPSQGTTVTVVTWDVPFGGGTQHYIWIDAMGNKYPLHHAEGMPASLAVPMHNHNGHSINWFYGLT